MKDFDYGIKEFLNKLGDIGYDTLIGFTDRETPPVLIDQVIRDTGAILDNGYTLVCLNKKKHSCEFDLLMRPLA